MSLSFSYRKEIFHNKTRFFPKIPILLQNKGHGIQTSALLDSGATDIFIPKEIAEALELELKNPAEAESWSGKFTVFESKIGIVVGKGSQTLRQIMPCLVPKEKTENEEVVFGRSFFRFFEITFDETNKTTKLKQSIKKGLK
ncbi:MAG: retroviral-like aspartic protease family protein [Candidatus ainarchaeum sp.]|nr:retroviral-like aspartic protease family protein [Candidatus ainarchaeum sp.]